MATVVVPPTAGARPAPSPSTKTQKRSKKVDGNNDLAGIKRQRLRIAGKKVESKDDIKKWILELIETKPRTPKQIQEATGYSNVTVWEYCKALAADGKIEREGQTWKKAGLSSQAVQVQAIEALSDEEIYKLPVMLNFLKAVQRKPSRHEAMVQFVSICMGRTIPTFKINPEAWQHPQTLDAIRTEYAKQTGLQRVPFYLRRSVRAFYLFGRKQPLSKSEAEEFGFDGKKDKIGAYNYVKLQDEEIERALDILTNVREGASQVDKMAAIEALPESELEFAALVAGGLEYFPRPERWLCAETSRFVIRYDKKGREILHTRIHEAKTNKTWPKYARNSRIIAILKRWLAIRQKGGFRHLFYDGNENTRESQLGRVLASYGRSKNIFDRLKELYTKLGKTPEKDEYFFMKPFYALRHCGAHLWLRRTKYNYGAIAGMGWEDIATLRTWYGDMDENMLDELVVDVAVQAAAST